MTAGSIGSNFGAKFLLENTSPISLCLESLLIIEIDGSQHADSESDQARRTELEARGFRVLRFWNDDVLKDMDSVCTTIIAYVRDVSLQPWR
ncbi:MULTISPECIES: DUF559 domain-containing protein [unclassified Mesorhizobium]|uniref:endonuclease domain-containing protein n=1 Tax=unclassified Mesorhizobium TaxID=325217 RepID=UPI0032AF92AC